MTQEHDNQIRNEICQLLADGTPLADIRVNDGDAEWGADGAVTVQQLTQIIRDWSVDQDVSDKSPDDLPRAIDWLRHHPAT